MANKRKLGRKAKLILALPAVLILLLAGFILTHSGLGINDNNLPKFIQSDFVDLSKIYSISKFRSLAGHDFSGNGETCRSMKHYFEPQQTDASARYMSEHQGIPAKPNGVDDIPVFSPVDGTIVDISQEHTPIGQQISIRPEKANQFNVRLFHVWPSKDIHGGIFLLGFGGTHVKAGQKIGVLGATQGTDISVQIGDMPWNEHYVSYFDVMPDNLFAVYQARGLKSRGDVVLSRAYRDAHSVTCQKKGDEKFNLPAGYNSSVEDYVHLSGYVAPREYIR